MNTKDPWIIKNSNISPEQLHALGVMTLYWNRAEFALFWLFCTISGVEGSKARILLHDMKVPTIQQKISDFLKANDYWPELVKEHVSFSLASFDICRVNRNQFTHFLPQKNTSGEIGLFRNKGPKFNFEELNHDLETMRQVADKIADTSMFMTNTANAIAKWRSTLDWKLKIFESPPAFPEKFALPEAVWKSVNAQEKSKKRKM